jgi:hypothetical protein
MQRISLATFAALALAVAGAALMPCGAAAQQGALKDQVVGTWTYVSVDTVRPDGTRVPMFGPNPQGRAMFDASGHYALITSRAGLPKFTSGNRSEGTPDENKAIVQGLIAHFGSYTVNDADRTITFRIDASSFPNWNGTVQARPFTITGDELRWTTAGSSGGTAEVVLKRAR